MTKREELQERYEDALFALMMDELAQAEGEKALEENERLKNDPEFSVPSAVEKRCLRLISSYFAKQSFSRATHIVAKATTKVAVVVLMGTLLFTSAFAVSEEFRTHALNWVITVFDDRTEFSFSPAEERVEERNDQDGSETTSYKITVGWLPKGYTLHDYEESEFFAYCLYCSEEGDEFSVSTFLIDYTTMNIDTEDADVSSVEISGKTAMLVKKDHLVQIVWVDEEHRQYVIVNGSESITEELVMVAQGIGINDT